MTKIKDLTGQRFGRIFVLEFVGIEKHKANFKCRCDCGKEFVTKGIYLSIGDTQSCGCLLKEKEVENGRAVGKRNMARYIDKVRQPSGDSARKHLYYLYGYKAKRREIKFELSLEEFSKITKENCHYCGISPYQIKVYKKAYGTYTYNGLDRLDSSRGYTIGNVVACCGICNTAKMDMSVEDFKIWIDRVYHHQHPNRLSANVSYTPESSKQILGDGTAKWYRDSIMSGAL